MVHKTYFKDTSLEKHLNLTVSNNESNQTSITINETLKGKVKEIAFFIEFSEEIISYRSFKYTWEKNSIKGAVLNPHNPKIIVLKNGIHVLSSNNIGAWEIVNSTTIKWILKSSQLTPLFQYNSDGSRTFKTEFLTDAYHLVLLYSKEKVPEFSRSKIPFKPIICFTDHCDFDNNDKLLKQLDFFKKNNTKISKGFFLNFYSKREDNSSFEKDSQIISRFQDDGHELFYHSLTQSIRDIEDSIREFKHFNKPKNLAIKTYVDHGYQPYNYTYCNHSGLSENEWVSVIKRNELQNFWTYLDSGTANQGIINQLNPNHFTISRILKTQRLNLKFLIRTALFFSGKENLLMSYRKIAVYAKEILYKKSIVNSIALFRHSLTCLFYMLYAVLINRNKVYKFSKLTPLIFSAKIGDSIFNFFQTIEVTNFEKSLSKSNIDLLIAEKGAFIAHCYFSSPMGHQQGKLFSGDVISRTNEENFKYLKQKIDLEEVWNPTISELIDFTNETANISFYIDKKTNLIKSKNEMVPIRYVNYE